ncbi:citrate lyase holo-[acyl-carrier protein] synthase [Mycoplasma sp. P36-A1]|uniref:citrate lyase holo-[acyl-carrier protein] synthase n=1 Tax=Mycoplasma sp. P36-A1 TaxID=3252900 RepID=UPI003C2D7DA4
MEDNLNIEINKLLQDREQRSIYQKKLQENNETLLVIKANYVGANKNNHYTAYAVIKAYMILANKLNINDFYMTSDNEGLIMYILSSEEVKSAKLKAIEVEDSFIGRLIDLDVYYQDIQYSRKDFNIAARTCFICDENAKICVRSQRHSYEQLKEYFEKIIIEDIFNNKAEVYSNLVLYGLINEINKPYNFGCVGIKTQGSHSDMDYKTFIKSISVLAPLYNKLTDINLKDFQELRILGIEMEKAMFNATNKINTHKGAIFTILMILAGLSISSSYTDASAAIKTLSKDIFTDFEALKNNSAGISIYKQHGIGGIREYAYNGYDILFDKIVPYYLTTRDDTKTYLLLISLLQDTTIIKRSSLDHLNKLQSLATNTNDYDYIQKYCLKHNISCGGSADMLAATFIIALIKDNYQLFKITIK